MRPSHRLNLVSIEFPTLCGFNVVGRAANSQILLACRLAGVQDNVI
jgi:hypothetical protein